MLPSVVTKTNKIAKTQILVEQVIRRLKVFRFFSNEVPIYIYIYIYIYIWTGLDKDYDFGHGYGFTCI